MDNPLDLKLLMNHNTNSSPASTLEAKTFKCETCNASYTDKMYYDLHRQSHQKDVASLTSKEIPIVQILQIPGGHSNSQPLEHEQQQQSPSQIIIQEDQLTAYKRAYGIEPQQIFTLAPVTQYQVIASTNRSSNIIPVSLSSQQSQVNISTYSTPTYVVAASPDGHHQIQALAEAVLQTESIHNNEDNQLQHSHHHFQNQTEVIEQHDEDHQVHLTSINSSRSSHRTYLVVSKERPYKCDQCTASFIDAEELIEHQKKHTGDGPFTCEDCHFTFMYKSHYRSHKTRCQKKRAMNPNPPRAVVIGHSPVKRQFPTHQAQQLTKEIYPHYITGAPFIQTAKFSNTNNKSCIIRQTNKPSQPSKFNPNNPSFKRTKKENRLGRPYECDECDASFQNDSDLKNHKSKHTGEGPFGCDECKFVFLYRKLYEAHRRRCEKKRKDSDQMQISILVPNISSISDTHSNISQPQQMTIGASTTIPSVLPGMVPLHTISGQHSVIDMRSASSQAHDIQQMHLATQLGGTPSHTVGGIVRHEIKYEMIPSVDIPDGVNVNQIMNLIKTKGTE